MLINICIGKIFQITLDSVETGIKVNGKPINNIRYADHTAINNPEDLQNMLEVSVQFRRKRTGTW